MLHVVNKHYGYIHMYVWMLHVCICMCIYTYIMYIWTYIDICIYIYNYIYTCTCAGLQRHPLVCFLTATWIEKWNLIFLNTCFNLCGSEDNMRVSGVISFGQRDDAPSKIRFEDFWDFKVFLRGGTRMLPSSQFEAKQFWNMRWSSSPKNQGNAAVHV